jgi:ATP-dependent 26S proteasome regulatory subunit
MAKAKKDMLADDEKVTKTESTPAADPAQQTTRRARVNQKIMDIMEYVRAGTPVLFVHDRDMISFLSDHGTIGIGSLMDDFTFYVFMQGFMMVRITKQKINSLQDKVVVTYTDDFNNQNQYVKSPAVALNLFLGKTANNIVPAQRNAVLILMMDPDLIDQDNMLAGSLREHYTNMTTNLQVPLIQLAREQGNRQGPLAGRVEEYHPGDDQTVVEQSPVRSVIILGSRPQLPNRLSGYCLNLGSVTRKLVSAARQNTLPDTLATSMTTPEIETAQRLYVQTSSDVDKIKRFRKAVFTSNGLIEDISTATLLADIGGYDGLKKFIDQRKVLIDKHSARLAEVNIALKGLFIAGVPGSGKTTILNAIGNHWGLPSYRLRLEAAFGRYVGDSEGALIGAMESLTKLAPCYCLLDEIDKSLAGVGEGEVAGSDVPKRVFGILLDYMGVNNGIIFGASANRVKSIPEEFMRRGRFDRIFFMDLPNLKARIMILNIHMKKHKYDLLKFDEKDITELGNVLENFTGAEIESVVNEAVMECIVEDVEMSTELLSRKALDTRTIDKDKKDIVELKEWAKVFATDAQKVQDS